MFSSFKFLILQKTYVVMAVGNITRRRNHWLFTDQEIVENLKAFTAFIVHPLSKGKIIWKYTCWLNIRLKLNFFEVSLWFMMLYDEFCRPYLYSFIYQRLIQHMRFIRNFRNCYVVIRWIQIDLFSTYLIYIVFWLINISVISERTNIDYWIIINTIIINVIIK